MLHRSAVALAWVVLVLGYVGLGISGDYPVLEQRTSTFLFAAFALVVGVGAAGVCVACGRLLTAWPRYSDRARPWVASGVTLALMAGAAAWYVSTNDEWFRHHSPFIDDVRSQTRYLAEHRLPDDVILVNSSSGWNFGYYWDEDEPSFRRMSDNAVGFGVTYPAATRIVVCRDRTGPAVRACFRRAQAESRAARGSRIWLVRTHVQADERTAWRLALKGHARVRAAASPRLMLVEARR